MLELGTIITGITLVFLVFASLIKVVWPFAVLVVVFAAMRRR